MARLMLQTKPEELKVQRIIKNNPMHILTNDISNFGLLTDNRYEDEKFSRVDKFFTNHYYLIGTEQLCERIFYPSEYGFEEINKEKHHPYKKIYNKLIEEGIGLCNERTIPIINKPIKRVIIKSKPQRMMLSCKEKE